MKVQTITYGRVTSIPHEYGNVKIEATATVGDDETEEQALARLKGFVINEALKDLHERMVFEEQQREREHAWRIEQDRIYREKVDSGEIKEEELPW